MTHYSIKSLVLLIAVGLIGCDRISHSQETLTMAPFQRSAVTLVGAQGKKVNATTFENLSGRMDVKGEKLLSIQIQTQVGSLATSDKKLSAMLKEKGFFNVAETPEASFQAKDIKMVEGSSSSAIISGDLNVKGKKFPVSVPANISYEKEQVVITVQTSVSKEIWMKAFGGDPTGFFDDKLDVVAKLTYPKTKTTTSGTTKKE